LPGAGAGAAGWRQAQDEPAPARTNLLDYAARAAARGSGLLASLSPRVGDEVLRNAIARRVKAGHRIYSAGEPADALWICATGVVRLSRASGTGRRRTLAYVTEGGWFGVAGFCTGAQDCDADAHTDLTMLSVPRADVQRRLDANPELCQALLLLMASQVAGLGEALADARSLPLDALMAKTLVALLEEHGRPLRKGSPANRLELPLAQSELGELIGYSRQHVNASLKRLERRGWIAQQARSIVVHDPTALRNSASTLPSQHKPSVLGSVSSRRG
jgi:CRP-like cAMP-binding protein